MGITIPTTREKADTVDLRTRSEIEAADWQALAQAEHYDYAWAGKRLGGRVFDPEATSDSAPYVQTSTTAASGDLTTTRPLGRLDRVLQDTSANASIAVSVSVWGAAVDFRARIYNDATSALIATLNPIRSSTTPGKATDTAYITLADTQDTAGDPAMLYVVEDWGSTNPGADMMSVSWVSGYEAVPTDGSRLPSGIPFVPTSISGAALWLDASDSSTLWQDAAASTPAANGDAVALWQDKSGNGNDAVQTTSSDRPSVASGRLQFDGTTNHFTVADDASYKASELTVFFVAQLTGSTGNYRGMIGYLHDNSYSGTPYWDWAMFQLSNGTIDLPVGSSYSFNAYTPAWNNHNVYSYETSPRKIWENGMLKADGSDAVVPYPNATSLWIGGDPASQCWSGYIDEILIYTRTLTTSERQRIEAYLKGKWGI